MSQIFPGILPGEPLFSPDHAAALREFLSTEIGQRLLRRLIYERPEVTSREVDQRRIQSDERQGFEACIATILKLAEPTT